MKKLAGFLMAAAASLALMMPAFADVIREGPFDAVPGGGWTVLTAVAVLLAVTAVLIYRAGKK